jgi:hypothetical protein
MILPFSLIPNNRCKTNPAMWQPLLQALVLHKGKSKALKVDATSTTPVLLDKEAFEEVENFVYLGSTVDKQGGKMLI